jgi:hypothetical protein
MGRIQRRGINIVAIEDCHKLQQGDAFFFMGSLITHNVHDVIGIQHSIDLFCHKTMLTWKDKCKKAEEKDWKGN